MADFPPPQSDPGEPGGRRSAPGCSPTRCSAIAAVLEIAGRGTGVAISAVGRSRHRRRHRRYVKRDDARGTWVASHFTWLIRTFWWSFLWGIVGCDR